MTVLVTHGKVSAAPAPVDASKVGGPDWNDPHNVVGLAAVAETGNATDLTGTLAAARMPAHTGDVTSSVGTVALTIANSAVTNAKAANMAANSIKGNNTGGSAVALDLTTSEVKTLLGLAPVATSASASDLTAGALGAARMPALTGDVTSTVGTVATTIAANAVTNAKAAQMATLTLKGNNTGGTTNAIDLTVAEVLAMLGIGASSPFYFGTGSDGAAVFDGSTAVTGCTRSGATYTMTRFCYWTTGVFSGGAILKVDGYVPHFNSTLSGTGTIDASAGNSTLDASGAAPWATARPMPNGLAGPVGTGSGQNGTGTTVSIRGLVNTGGTGGAGGGPNNGVAGGKGRGGGGGGGAAGAGGSGGNVTNASDTLGDWQEYANATQGRQDGAAAGATRASLQPGTPGGSGGFSGAVSGGGGGGSGGWLTIYVKLLSGTGITFQAKGGNGGNGGTNGTFGAGGGGGGAGGVVVMVIGPTVTPPTPVVTGGTGGTGAAGSTISGGNGAAGGAGDFLIFQ